MTLFFVGYFLVPFPLTSIKRVPGDVFGHAKLIDRFFMNFFCGRIIDLFCLWP